MPLSLVNQPVKKAFAIGTFLLSVIEVLISAFIDRPLFGVNIGSLLGAVGCALAFLMLLFDFDHESNRGPAHIVIFLLLVGGMDYFVITRVVPRVFVDSGSLTVTGKWIFVGGLAVMSLFALITYLVVSGMNPWAAIVAVLTGYAFVIVGAYYLSFVIAGIVIVLYFVAIAAAIVTALYFASQFLSSAPYPVPPPQPVEPRRPTVPPVPPRSPGIKRPYKASP
ncbi:hypothetical protein C3F09_06990 [candidate division GN15 bacterium]|uniref:Uncharacterized protein n=1 Tax=candidate division GN15 bacterium TaxID=2072418 RepID=A0A855X5P9_9BACT|nr:MAG: hypothetical protein C3F09_06990 [candidate division GN15 bacterium]